MGGGVTNEQSRERLDQLRAVRDAAGRDMGYFTPNLGDAYASTTVSLNELDAEIAQIELKLGLRSK
jgi:hypothetical protein